MRKKKKLRSQEWFGSNDKMGFVHRSWLRNQGYPDDHFRGKPVIGICNTWSDLTPCNGHLRDLAQFVKNGVLEAGGFPLEFPVMSLGETIMRPTTMLFRNLASMDVEESIRANLVYLNAGAALYVYDLVTSIKDGFQMAKEIAQSKKAVDILNDFIKFSNS